jgi:hypothetical protein
MVTHTPDDEVGIQSAGSWSHSYLKANSAAYTPLLLGSLSHGRTVISGLLS